VSRTVESAAAVATPAVDVTNPKKLRDYIVAHQLTVKGVSVKAHAKRGVYDDSASYIVDAGQEHARL
jgi:hypothetical protein